MLSLCSSQHHRIVHRDLRVVHAVLTPGRFLLLNSTQIHPETSVFGMRLRQVAGKGIRASLQPLFSRRADVGTSRQSLSPVSDDVYVLQFV